MNSEVFKNLAVKLAKQAGKILLDNLESVEIVKFKDRQDIVTNIDLKIEKIMIDSIKKNFPSHNINTEERGVIKGESNYTWIIDPLDGTKHYIRKIPLFSISIALQYKNELIFGLVYNPTTKEMFCAQKDKGAYLNDKKIRVSEQKNFKNSFIYTELPSFDMKNDEFKRASEILTNLNLHSYRVRAFGSGPLGLCYVALGAFEAYITLGKPTKIGDMAAGLIILKEAGGKCTDLMGGPIKLEDKLTILASNGKLHREILNLLK